MDRDSQKGEGGHMLYDKEQFDRSKVIYMYYSYMGVGDSCTWQYVRQSDGTWIVAETVCFDDNNELLSEYENDDSIVRITSEEFIQNMNRIDIEEPTDWRVGYIV